MKHRGKPERAAKHTMLSPSDEQILRILYIYRYLTALDVAWLLFSPNSIAYVRRRLSLLAGGTDLHPNMYLCRLPSPSVTPNKPEKVFTLGMKGRNFLTREAGLTVDWYFRPSKYRSLSFSHLRHAQLLSRFVVAANVVSRMDNGVRLLDARFSYELSQSRMPVTPDAWLLFAHEGRTHPVMLEIDRGTELEARFKQHIQTRLRLVESGEYTRLFGTRAVIIAYATTTQSPEHAQARRKRMLAWTKDILEELELTGWAGICRFTSELAFETLYTQAPVLFTDPVWYQPDSDSPVLLLAP